MKKYLILFISIFCSFILIDKVKAEVIEYTIPNTEVSFSYDLDTDRYPYYIGNIHTQAYNNTIYLSLYYFDSPYIVSSAHQSTTCMPLDSNYPQTPCYLSARKQDNTRAYRVYYKYSTIDGHLIETNNNNPTFLYTYDNVILSYYNYDDYIENISSFEYINNIYPKFGTPVGWILSDSITSPQTDYTLTPEYINSSEPIATYLVSNGSEIGKKITFDFKYFDNNSYADITNLTTGDIIHLTDLKINYSYIIDNISFDSVYYIEVYNNDSLVYVDTIDINEEVRLAKKPYINLTLDKERLIAWLEFMNLKPDYHVYYSKNNGQFSEVFLEENKNSIIVGFNNEQPELHNKNYTIHGKITDSNNNILYERGYNIVFFPDSPYFTFKSSYNSDSGCNQLTITFHNSLDSDIVSYSFDNSSFQNFSNVKTNVLELCSNSHIYVKATRGNDIYYGYYYVNISEFSSSSNESFQQDLSLLTTFNNLFTGIDLSFLSNINSFFNALKSSYVFRFLMLCITGALILFIMRLIRR